MKKTVLLSMLIGCAMFCHAQVKFTHTKSNPFGIVTNAGVDTSYFPLPGYYETLAIQPCAVKVSGTMAGTEVLQVSVNDTDWIAPAGDTVTLSNVARQVPVIIHISKPDFLFMRIITTGSGTTVFQTEHTLGAKKTSF